MTFIDFSKAFDSIPRSKLPVILAVYKISPLIILAVALYTNTKARVMTLEGIPMEFLTILVFCKETCQPPSAGLQTKTPALVSLSTKQDQEDNLLSTPQILTSLITSQLSLILLWTTHSFVNLLLTQQPWQPLAHSMDTRWKSNLSRQLTSSYS